ncbi:MAG: hypothetical protein V1799_13080 [bacterium]
MAAGRYVHKNNFFFSSNRQSQIFNSQFLLIAFPPTIFYLSNIVYYNYEGKAMNVLREDHEPPLATAQWGWRYHHLGIPTTIPVPGENYIPHLKIYVSGFSTSPFGIEWMRFDDDCPISELVRTVPHIAFEVDNLEAALQQSDFEIMTAMTIPSEGVRVAMIKHHGAPIELIEFQK